MRTGLRRRSIRRDTIVIAGQRYDSISRVARELGWSRDAIINWLTVPQKFTAGSILRVAIINHGRWFTRDSVRNAKIALRLHGRLRRSSQD